MPVMQTHNLAKQVNQRRCNTKPDVSTSRARTLCRLNGLGQSEEARRLDRPLDHVLARRLSYDDAARAIRRRSEAASSWAVLDADANEEGWLEFELALTLHGLGGGHVDLDEAVRTLGHAGVRRFVARAAALCARRGAALHVTTRRQPTDCPLRRNCGPLPPCARPAPLLLGTASADIRPV